MPTHHGDRQFSFALHPPFELPRGRQKRSLLPACLAALLFPAVVEATLLVDSNMNLIGPNGMLSDTPNAPWVVTAERGGTAFLDGASSEVWADHDGGGTGLYIRGWNGNPPWDPTTGPLDVDIHQDVIGQAGVIYSLTGWWGAEANFSGFVTPGANAIFALDFLNGVGGLLASVELDLEAAGLGGGPTGLNFEQFSLSGTAPNGTAVVRARGSLLDGVFYQDPGQALVTDEWSLTAATSIPEPSTAALWCVGLSLIAARRRFCND